MSHETFVSLLVFVGALVVALLWVVDRTNKRVADAVPPDVLRVLSVTVAALEKLAQGTEITLDDEVVALVKRLLDDTDEPPVTPLAAKNILVQ